VKGRIATGGLVVSFLLFFTGFLLLCYCPGWYALAAGFAGLAAFLGKSGTRYLGIGFLLASLAFTVIHWELKLREAERFGELRRRIEETNQALFRNNWSDSGISTLKGATRVEVFRVGSEKLQKPTSNTIGGYPILSAGKEKDQAFAGRLTNLLLGDGVTRNAKKCGLEPGVAYRLWNGDQAVEVLVCFKCDVLWPHLVGEQGKLPHQEWQDFDSARADLLELTREAFPEDLEIQNLPAKRSQ